MAVDSAGTQRFQVQYDPLDDAATRALPEQVAALGRTRDTLLARSVPAEWLGRLPGSQTAATSHAGNVAESARQLANAVGRLDEIIGVMRATSTGTRGLDDTHTKKQQEQNQRLAQATEQLGQRDKAMAVLKEIEKEHPISVAAVARNQLENFMFVGNGAAGEIGDHYDKDVRDLLSKPPTDANLRELAEKETEFWYSDRGSWAGKLLGPDWREGLLHWSRSDWLGELSPADRAEALKQIGTPAP